MVKGRSGKAHFSLFMDSVTNITMNLQRVYFTEENPPAALKLIGHSINGDITRLALFNIYRALCFLFVYFDTTKEFCRTHLLFKQSIHITVSGNSQQQWRFVLVIHFLYVFFKLKYFIENVLENIFSMTYVSSLNFYILSSFQRFFLE